MLGLTATTPLELLTEAGYPIDPENVGIIRRDPFRLAAAADVLVEENPQLKRGEIAWPHIRTVRYRPDRPEIVRENIIEGIWHVERNHPAGSWYTHNRANQPFEQEARALTLETLATDAELDFLLRTDAPKTFSYYAGRFGFTKRGLRERMKMRGQEALLEDPPRAASGLAQRGNCHQCGRYRWLVPHHETYVRLGREWDGDGALLCDHCHAGRHSS